MLHQELENIEKLIDNYDNNELSDLEKNTKNLKEYSTYAGTTPTEKSIIRNSELLTEAFTANNKIHKELIKINNKIAEHLSNIEELAAKGDKRIEAYQTEMNNTSHNIISNYKETVLSKADNCIQALAEKQDETFSICMNELQHIQAANESIIDAQNDYAQSLIDLKTTTSKSAIKWSTMAGLVMLLAIVILAVAACSAVFVSFTLIPQVSEILYQFWTITGIFGIVGISVVGFLAYCIITGRKNR